MNKYQPKKRFGQNFIKNKQLLEKIVGFIDIKKNDLVIEIGLGQGDLTEAILKKNPFYIGYEVDEDLKPFLEKYIEKKVFINYEDFLKANIKETIKDIDYSKLYIISNLPYYITTPIINKIINEKLPVHQMLLMMQKEVGDRFTAQPSTRLYGSITVHLNYYFNISKVLTVGKENFTPKPKVDSVVLLFESKETKESVDQKTFQSVLKESFQFKRKNIKNNLKKYDLKTIEKILSKHGFSLNSRAEELPLNIFVEIANNISK
ncbi:MAG: ribosomal RNA small subunit methyltransferase A [Mollicutes bacterium]|nr:ribosomal RNA small subunit methyltransferase A [Mollicutes bacterium]